MNFWFRPVRLAVLAACCTLPLLGHAQSVGIGTSTPDPSAALDVQPADPATRPQGFLPPRLTYQQRTGISNAAAGLLVYQTDASTAPAAPAGYYYYTGTQWLPLLSQGDNLGNHTATEDLKIPGSMFLETGAGVSGKEASAGKIAYQRYSDALDIIGAGTNTGNRRIRLWAEGGTEVSGPFRVEGGNPAAGRVLTSTDATGNTAWQALPTYSASNGLSQSGNATLLGGPLTQTTTLTLGSYSLGMWKASTVPATLDPAVLGPNHGNSMASPAGLTQTFRAGATGALSHLELLLGNSPGMRSFTLTIWAGAAGTGTQLYSALQTVSATGAAVVYSFTPYASLTQGQSYTIQLTSANTIFWHYSNNNPYPNGQASTGSNNDFVFRTSINNAAPVLMATGAGIGIGTSNPQAALHVAGPARFDGLAGVGTRLVTTDANGTLTTQGGGNLALADNWLSNDGNNTGLRIDNAGNVGIGVAAPAAQLHVAGSTRLDGLAGTGTRLVTADASGTLSATQALQAGLATIGSTSGTNFKQVTVTFPTAYATVPRTIICTVRNPDNGFSYTDVFTATIATATTTGFTVNVRCDNGPGDWTQELMLSWLALP
jgi:hypothetical protein